MYMKTTLAVIGIALVLVVGITATVQQVSAIGPCLKCARELAPGILGDPTESAPGHQALFPGNAQNFAPGIEKQQTPTT